MKHTNHGVYSPQDCPACDLAAYRAIGSPEQIKAVISEVEKTVEALAKRIKIKVDAGGDGIIEYCLRTALDALK